MAASVADLERFNPIGPVGEQRELISGIREHGVEVEANPA
jgi:hypothetical protein